MMIEKNIEFALPTPWAGQQFKADKLAAVNFLVGPNGSGKSQFARTLYATLPAARLLGTDRLSGMEQTNYFRNVFGDNFAQGLAKNYFDHYRSAGASGSGVDTIVLLEERMDLRIQVEATLSSLFNRAISLEWDSGHLVPRATHGQTGLSYRLDREECHGIKELLVLLTHLYNDKYSYLIIDEPELNLHPQYQAFFMQEVRRVAGNPDAEPGKKVVCLITHSPFILDFRSIEDVKAVISFDEKHSIPRQILDLDEGATQRLSSLVPRLNVHHKQFFFSDNPVFVEGILDAQFIGTLQNARGVSVAAAGSCIIDAGGCEEVNRYLELCIKFGKEAHFLYDLDSLFSGNLRACLREDGTVANFLSEAGLGNDFSKYCGELDRRLTTLIDEVLRIRPAAPPLSVLVEYFDSLGARPAWNAKHLGRARVALLTAISRDREGMVALLTQASISDVEGRLSRIVSALDQKNVHLLAGGTLERYLPSYTANPYKLDDETKRAAVTEEMTHLARGATHTQLRERYGQLYEAVSKLPSKSAVDVEPVLRTYPSRYIHDLQSAIVGHVKWDIDQLRSHMANVQRATTGVFALDQFVREDNGDFHAVVGISDMLGQGPRRVHVDRKTNAGVGEFRIEAG
ncbi:ATP-dependent endonuclease [Pandoraea sp. ISTKB]|uniref:ATP-dependent nuclease n=1 Tax=Pandoraea sp. ISTKB TaxID=1586708 RepID=UPI0008478A13|nr:AAA family ATPase [Pandoraea sp. ISTKB]ODP35511.1 hypothetical protein A9762_00370 [Pandoraea sp. ISTKB]